MPTPASLRRRILGKEVFDLLLRERGGGLVEEEDLGASRHGGGDLGHGAAGDGEAAGLVADVELLAEGSDHRLGARVGGVPVDEARGTGHEAAAEEHVLGDAELGKELGFLVDDVDAGVGGFAGAAQAAGRAVEQERASIGGEEASGDVDKGTFTRAVFADEAMYLAGQHVDAAIAKRSDAAEALLDLGECENGPVHRAG